MTRDTPSAVDKTAAILFAEIAKARKAGRLDRSLALFTTRPRVAALVWRHPPLAMGVRDALARLDGATLAGFGATAAEAARHLSLAGVSDDRSLRAALVAAINLLRERELANEGPRPDSHE